MSPTYSVCADHGYITGEQYTCPICGKKTEVYSRITGYYRPVQNWNDGKSQEYKDRKVYNVATSELKKQAPQIVVLTAEDVPAVAPVVEAAPAVCGGKVMLFSRVTCPNCRVAESLLTKAGIPFEKLIADENVELCKQYGIKGAPTLVITDGETFESHYSVPEIKKYIASL
jgi:ribonucleoside-triphosphate reductase